MAVVNVPAAGVTAPITQFSIAIPVIVPEIIWLASIAIFTSLAAVICPCALTVNCPTLAAKPYVPAVTPVLVILSVIVPAPLVTVKPAPKGTEAVLPNLTH